MYTCTFHEADTLRERRHMCDVRANTRPQAAISFEVPRLRRGTKTYVGYHNSGDRAEEDGVTTHEGQEARCTIQPGMRLLPNKDILEVFFRDARTSRVFPMGKASIRQGMRR